MEEALLTFGFAILAVGVAAFLRRCRNRREASEDIITLVKKIAALEQRTRDFELQRRLSELRLGCSVVPTAKMESDRPQPVPLAATPNEPAFARMLGRENGLARVERRLYALKSILPEDIYLGEKYVAEFDSILNLVEQESGSTLDRFRISAPCKRSIFRLNILGLLGFFATITFITLNSREASSQLPRKQPVESISVKQNGVLPFFGHGVPAV